MRKALLALTLLASSSTPAFAQCDCGGGDNGGGTDTGWQESFVPGGADPNGKILNQTEIRQFVPYGGKLYVAAGAWMDQGSPKGSASILRLDGPDEPWRLEISFGGAGTTTGGLASLRFTQSKNGSPVDVSVLTAATWSGANAYSRNEVDQKWYKTDFGSGQIRTFGVHKDLVANATFAFAGGKPGIFRGQLADSRPAGKTPIAWAQTPELNTVNMNLPLCSGGGRITGFAEARGAMFASACWRVFKRTDGPIGKCSGPSQVEVNGACQARWVRFWDDPLAGQGESGLRGMTQIMYQGNQVLLIGSEVANAHVTRLDPVTAQSVVEFNVDQYLDKLWAPANSGYKIVAYNAPMPLWYGADGAGRRILGFESWLPGKPTPGMARKLVNATQLMLGEGMLFLRNSATNYQLVHLPAVTSQPMTAVRDCVASPFPSECNAKGQDCMVYCGGFDANKSTTQTPCTTSPCTIPPLVAVPTRNTAWIVKGRLPAPATLGAPDEAAPEESLVPDIHQEDEPSIEEPSVPPSNEGEQ
jgi:hypothetical protein